MIEVVVQRATFHDWMEEVSRAAELVGGPR